MHTCMHAYIHTHIHTYMHKVHTGLVLRIEAASRSCVIGNTVQHWTETEINSSTSWLQVHQGDQPRLPPSCIASLACACMMATCPLHIQSYSYHALCKKGLHTHVYIYICVWQQAALWSTYFRFFEKWFNRYCSRTLTEQKLWQDSTRFK